MERINIKNNRDCCGCSACADACPKSCIKMEADREGFVYPVADDAVCISCGKCKAACPIVNAKNVKKGTADDTAYAYVASDDGVVYSSSSGGAFSLIMDGFAASYSDFVIVGAALVGTQVKHIAASDRRCADAFRKSKYIQSNTFGIFKYVKSMLLENKAVLFSGTPCQVAALKCYLGRDYEKLLTVDIVCHGVPSQIHFDEYLKGIEEKNGSKAVGAEFRYKRNYNGDKPNPRTVNVFFENGKCVNMGISESEFLYAYYTGLIYRPSCEVCRFACPSRPGDITLGDFWGIEKVEPRLNSLKGVSLVRFNSDMGKFLIPFFEENGVFIKASWEFACAENYQLSFPATPH